MPNTDSKKNPFTKEVLEQFTKETPFFIFSKDRLIEKFKEFKRYFHNADIHYAMKANAEPELLKILYEAGSNFEVASMYELDMLKEIGVPPNRMIYGTAVKQVSHIKAFVEYGVDRFAFDSFSELEKIALIAPNSRVYVRLSVNDTGSVFKFSEKFGTSNENIVPLLSRAVELGLKPYGISFNVGSQASNYKAWAEAISMLGPIMEELETVDIKIEVIDLGGGFPCDKYTSSEIDFNLEDIAKETLAAYEKLPYQPMVIVEPGRALVAESAVLVTNVIAKVPRNQNQWLFLDAGVYTGLFESMVYQGGTRYKVTMLRQSFDSGEAPFALAGPTGDSPDVITREVFLPSDVDIGDKLIIHDIGAYSLVAVSLFNGFPKPAVHFV